MNKFISVFCVFPISCAVAWFHRVIFFVFVLVKGGEFHLDFWILLVPKMVISKLSGNTVESTHPSLQKAFWYMPFHRKLNSINTKFDLRIKLPPIWCPDWLIWWQLKSGASWRGFLQPQLNLERSRMSASNFWRKSDRK